MSISGLLSFSSFVLHILCTFICNIYYLLLTLTTFLIIALSHILPPAVSLNVFLLLFLSLLILSLSGDNLRCFSIFNSLHVYLF
ncbi:hypothetical protein V1511DRAFT_312534 [Dipodascopsis uninucleata]